MSETSEYIMGQVRACRLILADAKLWNRAGNRGMTGSLLEQLNQELEFLTAMLVQHPPYKPTKR